MKKIVIWALLVIPQLLYCREEKPKIKQLQLGNLALKSSQQQAPLFSFGQLIMEQGSMLGWLFFDYIQSDKNKKNSVISVNLLYAAADNVSLAFTIPFTIVQQQETFSVQGLNDIIIDVEWAYYAKFWETATLQATIVGSFFLPMGVPPLASGSPVFFLGTTLSYLSIDWYAFTSYGVYLPTKFERFKFGKQFLYEFGVGHHIVNVDGIVIAGVIEVDGVFTQSTRVNGLPNVTIENIPSGIAGGNSIAIGPSFWIASDNLVIQPGIQAIIQRHLQGNQLRNRFIVSLDIAYTFH